MFIVFEGIDGSGKTTVSNRVANALVARGVAVSHVRADGTYGSSIAETLRAIGREPQHLTMDAYTELALYAAREAQVLADSVRPALARGELVIADRYLYSAFVLATRARGLAPERVRSVIDGISGGLWPDLVVLLDVDPHLARARRRSAKLERKATGQKKGKGRKGLFGAGLGHHLAAGYRELARGDAERWLVVDNNKPGQDLNELVDEVLLVVGDMIDGKTAPAVAASQSAIAKPTRPAAELVASVDQFFAEVEARAQTEPGLAAHLLAGIAGQRAHEAREKLLVEAPHQIAYGLRGVTDDSSWEMRERLAAKSPAYIARSCGGRISSQERSQAMLEELAERAPKPVLSAVAGRDDEFAWALRDRLGKAQPFGLVASLRGLDCDRSWAAREDFLTRHISSNKDLQPANALLGSLRGLSDKRAWALRDRHLHDAPLAVLASLGGVFDERAWELRQRFVPYASKIVLTSVNRSDDPRAWSLRESYGQRVKECVDSLSGMDNDSSWALRERLADTWPSTTVKTMPSPLGTRGRQLASRLFREYGGVSVSLLKHCAKAVIDEEALEVSHAV